MSPSIKVPNKSDTWWLIIFCVWSNMDLIMKRGKKTDVKAIRRFLVSFISNYWVSIGSNILPGPQEKLGEAELQ